MAIEATREVAADFGESAVRVEVVTLKEAEGAARYRELRRQAGEHLPVPSVLVEGSLAFATIPEPDELRAVFQKALSGESGL